MLSEMLPFRAAMTKREPHPSLTRNESGPRDLMRLAAANKAEATEPK